MRPSNPLTQMFADRIPGHRIDNDDQRQHHQRTYQQRQSPPRGSGAMKQNRMSSSSTFAVYRLEDARPYRRARVANGNSAHSAQPSLEYGILTARRKHAQVRPHTAF